MNETIEDREEKTDREWREMNDGIRAMLALEAARLGVERERKLGGFGHLAWLLRGRIAYFRLGFFDGWLKGMEYAWQYASKELEANRGRR